MERRNKITTGKQFEIIISELEKKPSLARGIHRGATLITSFRQDWEEITIKLNAHGPPIRNCDGWLRVWRDFKFKLRKKLSGGKTKNILFPLEEAAAKLIFSENQLNDENSELEPTVEEIKSESLDQAIWEDEVEFQPENHSIIDEIKTEDYCMLDQTLFGDEEKLPSTSANSFQVQVLASPDRKKKKRIRKCDQRQELLEKHHAMQQEILNEISNTMEELKDVLKNSGVYQEKLLEIEERKLQLVQRQHEREEQLFKYEMKLKIMEMKIKTKK